MSETRSKLRESIREMVVVVGSILIAFGLDAMWDDHKERKEEDRILASVAADMRFNIDELNRAVQSHREVYDACVELFGHMVPDPEPMVASTFDSLANMLTGYSTYDPHTGAIDALLRGQLSIVENEPLRMELAAWPETLRDFREDEERAAQEVIERVSPMLYAMIPVGLFVTEGLFGPVPGWPEANAERLTPDVIRAVLGDLALANEVFMKVHREHIIIGEAEDLRALMTRIVDLIDEELGG